MEWVKRKRYVPSHDLDPKLRRRGHCQFLPKDEDVIRAFRATRGKFREFLNVLMHTGMRSNEIRTVLVEQFDRENRRLVLWKHKTVEKTGLPKVVII